mmetsp:Transcript_5148/g.7505  ORF Transcript_5148/g.7505 Transcript_5148/m.7505 type:complete len:93 (+) Transcript_5148:24-302(+)
MKGGGGGIGRFARKKPTSTNKEESNDLNKEKYVAAPPHLGASMQHGVASDVTNTIDDMFAGFGERPTTAGIPQFHCFEEALGRNDDNLSKCG